MTLHICFHDWGQWYHTSLHFWKKGYSAWPIPGERRYCRKCGCCQTRRIEQPAERHK